MILILILIVNITQHAILDITVWCVVATIFVLSIVVLIWLYYIQKQPEVEFIPVADLISEEFIDIEIEQEVILSGYEVEDIDSP